MIYKKIFNILFNKLNTLLYLNKIRVIQLPVIDICNSHCYMCNIWKNKKTYFINKEQYSDILSDKIFRNVISIGINGGEPTLREDLFSIIEIITLKLKKLKYVNIITNGVDEEKIFKIVMKINNFLIEKKIKFDVSVSLDGDKYFHEINRGVKGNFLSAINLIKKLKTENINVWIGCTLSKKNIYSGDDVIQLAKDYNINKYKVRLAVDIKRLNNIGFYNSQNLDKDEIFHLTQFFQKLYFNEKNTFYYSLYRQLGYFEKRIAGCSWQTNGATLDEKGNLSYCSVASPILGNCLNEKPAKIYLNNKNIRKNIIKSYCDNCMHDLIGPLKFKNMFLLGKKIIKNKINNKLLTINLRYNKFKKRYFLRSKKQLKDAKSIIITGWWGTETHGDKAILGELFFFLNNRFPNINKIYLTCFPDMKYVVKKTIQELQETKIVDISKFSGIISIVNFHKSREFKESDFIIFGGGPIQKIYYLIYIEKAFRYAVKKNKGTFIFGCGINPDINNFKNLVKSLLKHSQYTFFRDKQSHIIAKELNKDDYSNYACDPAVSFIKRWFDKYSKKTSNYKYNLSILVRKNTDEYIKDKNLEEIEKLNNEKSKEIAIFLDKANKKIGFFSMHNLWVGGDDRIYTRNIINYIEKKNNIDYFSHKYMSLNELLNEIKSTKIILAARYHSHLFSFALNIPFISIDYSGEKNKIYNFINELNLEDISIDWYKFNAHKLIKIYNILDENYYLYKDKLNYELKNKIELLYKVYDSFI